MNSLSFYLVTDTHYFDSSFKRSGSAYEKRSITDQKCVAETPAIIDAGFAKIAQDDETDIILIPGDLVYRGEYQSHIGFRNRLYKLREAGKKIYLITARHDYSGNPVEFDGDKTVPVKGMQREELRDFYKDFGFDEAISEHMESMSYVAELNEDVRLLALNCDGDCGDFKGIWKNQTEWALEQIKKAHSEGKYIFAITHYPLLPFSPIMELINDAKLPFVIGIGTLISGTIASALSPKVLYGEHSIIQYVQPTDIDPNPEQSLKTKILMLFFYTIFHGIMMFLAGVPFFFYKLTGKRKEEVHNAALAMRNDFDSESEN